MDKKKERRKTAENTVLAQQAAENVNRYGDAVFQYVDGYFGEQDAAGKVVRKGLQDIKNSRVHPDYYDQNIKQQSGFSAEIFYESKSNAENILNGNADRVRRTDNLGMKNDQKFDHLRLDDQANVKSGSQMKFRGDAATPEKSAQQNINKLVGDKEWGKYHDAEITIPSEQYPHAKQYAQQQAEKLSAQADKLRNNGDYAKADMLQEKASRYDQMSKNLKDSGISSEQAIELRLRPEKVTIRQSLKTAHQGGLEQAKAGAVFSGAFSGARNLTSVINGEKEVGEAIVDTAVDTAKGAAVSYVVSAGGSLVKAGMQEASKRIVHEGGKSLATSLSKGNAPALIVSTTLEVGKSVKRYIDGDIDSKELMVELGEKGTGIIASTYGAELGAILGTLVLPGIGTIAGSIIGGMVGYMAGSQLYQSTLQFLAMPLDAEKHRRIKEMSEQALKVMQKEREELERLIEQHFKDRHEMLRTHFTEMREAILANQPDRIVQQLGHIAVAFGGTLQFKNFKEFDEFMLDDNISFQL
ncbi:hypothetical protein [Ammoniphilus resinae]|uniref:Small metal-binding protein n=1 Tax=Ammoniphilus resinae TaxID=861532 RepID=A0ABS4GXK1_9BACL|nr:hypothetical protein [Ammoniphilus resinae]MBP1934997.1 putative small metal-binding protein [Ammoniphilus resinae]